MKLKDPIRVMEDYPIEGISYKDITTLLKNPQAYAEAIDAMVEFSKNFAFDLILTAD